MARNIEIKARVADFAAVRSKAAALAATPPAIIHQTDVFFEVPKGRLKVRVFADGSGELIAYTRPNRKGPKVSTYERVPCRDARAVAEALAAVLPVRGTVVKDRELLQVGRTRVHLDQVRHLGTFVELEVVMAEDEPAENGICEAHALLAALEIPEAALVPSAYIDLLEGLRALDTGTPQRPGRARA